MLLKAIDPKLSVKDVDTAKGIVTGYFSTYNIKDTDGDIILPGAFTKTVAEQGPLGKDSIKHLRQHDRNQLVGRILKLDPYDSTGLYFESVMSKSALGQDTLTLYQEGILNQHSFAAIPVPSQTKYDKATDTTYMSELRMKEGSVVTWGANAQTPVLSIKEEFDLLDRIETFLRRGSATDETFLELEKIKNRIETLLLLKAATEPDKTTLNALKEQEETTDILTYFKARAK